MSAELNAFGFNLLYALHQIKLTAKRESNRQNIDNTWKNIVFRGKHYSIIHPLVLFFIFNKKNYADKLQTLQTVQMIVIHT